MINVNHLSDILREVEKDCDNGVKSLKIAYSSTSQNNEFVCVYKSSNEIMLYTSTNSNIDVEELHEWNKHLNASIQIIEI